MEFDVVEGEKVSCSLVVKTIWFLLGLKSTIFFATLKKSTILIVNLDNCIFLF